MPHLTEAVSLDPENAKYRHTLGLAKCVTGDNAGAREELLEAALLDEEDAEDRYKLRMRRIRERQRKSEEEKRASEKSDGATGAAASQVRGVCKCVANIARHRSRKALQGRTQSAAWILHGPSKNTWLCTGSGELSKCRLSADYSRQLSRVATDRGRSFVPR